MRQTIRTFFALCACTGLLSACGGGGGGGGSSAPVTSTESFNLRAAYVNYINDSRSLPYTISGTISGYSATGSGTLTQGSLTSATFEGQAALAKVQTSTGTLYANNRTVPLAATSTSYVDSNYNALGSNGAEYEVVSSSNTISSAARVNDTGIWFVTNRYTSSSKTSLLGTATTSFVLEPDTASTALLKIIEVERNTSNTVTSTSTSTFRITPGGSLTWIGETLLEGSTAVILTY